MIGAHECSRANNVEFDDESAATARGSIKLNNQVAPQPSVRCRIDEAYSPLFVEADKSAPLRGYVYFPYDEDYDIGGDFALSGTFPTQTFHARRGQSFEIKFSVRIPPEEKFFEANTRGSNAPAEGAGTAGIEGQYGYDEGLDACTLFLQKGGDRTAPLSWAVGVVNTGEVFETQTGASSFERPSNYALTFMWLDSAGWGEPTINNMRYSLSNPSAGSSGEYSTSSLRAIVSEKFLQPGRRYHIAVRLKLDTAAITDSSWNDDGEFEIACIEEYGSVERFTFTDSSGSGTADGLYVWKGPLDSLQYLCRYGIRYSGRDAMFGGLGYRTSPWNAQGFIPYGADSAAMENFGFRMVDRSNKSADDLYGSGNYTLNSNAHTLGNAYIEIDNNRGLTTGNTNFSQAPTGPSGSVWQGFTSSGHNDEALRGYRVVFPKNAVLASSSGGILNLETYTESGSNYRLTVTSGATLPSYASDIPILIQAFRWQQMNVELQDVRIYSSGNDYTDARTAFSLRSSLALDDETEPNLNNLLAYWPLTDGEGAACRELIRGRDAFLCPFGLGVSENGQEGSNMLFLSGEGEALTLDLSEHPVFKREFRNLLDSGVGGFAVELSMVMPEAYYGVDELSGTTREATLCPDIAAWSVKNADEVGTLTKPEPLMVLTHRVDWTSALGIDPIRRPMGFQLKVATGSDQENDGLTRAFFAHTAGTNATYNENATWVGKRITIQFGVESTGTTDQFRAYVAASPKDVLAPADGDPANAEFAYYGTFTINRKELERAVVTVGGAWDPGSKGYTEYSCRMLVDSVRVYGAAAPGALPASSGGIAPLRDGKLYGGNSLPQRELAESEILRPLGSGLRTIQATEGSTTVSPGSRTRFFVAEPEATVDACKEAYLIAQGDRLEVPSEATVERDVEEFYYIDTVASDGSSLSLVTPYNNSTQTNVSASRFSMIGYTVFEAASAEIERQALTLGAGTAYKPGTTKTKDLILSEPYFVNRAPVSESWRLRIAPPFTQGGLAGVLPQWSRGIVSPRRNPVTGVSSLDDMYVGTSQGCIYELDDRWRNDGPTPTLTKSLAFRSRRIINREPAFPLESDALEFEQYENTWPYFALARYDGYTWVYDVWLKLDRYAVYQTIFWLGCTETDLEQTPGFTNATRGLGFWYRLNNGRPEMVRATAATYDGSNRPEDGEYTATSEDRIPLNEWTHLRCYLRHYDDGSNVVIEKPRFAINGRVRPAILNATDNAVGSDDWIIASNGGGIIPVSYPDSRNAMLVGLARDNYRDPEATLETARNELGGRVLAPGRVLGYMHPLEGQMADLVVWRATNATATVSGYPSFNPYALDYTGYLLRLRAKMQEGQGYLVEDTLNDTEGVAAVPGIIQSHPAISRVNSFGRSRSRVSFASIANKVYAANGGRVHYLDAERGGPAGIVQPTTKPQFSVIRKPLWTPNAFTAGDAESDPITGAATGSGDQINHYSSFGNNYVTQQNDELMEWTKDDSTGNFDVFGFKCYWKPRSIEGRIQIYGSRQSVESGGIFLESRDGVPYVGWYDQYLKKTTWVRGSSATFVPGFWHYINLRKAFPLQSEVDGNWQNSVWSNGALRYAGIDNISGTFQVGEVIDDTATGLKTGFVVKVGTDFLEYILTSGSDFADNDGIDGLTSGASADINTPSSAPYHKTGDALIVRRLMKEAAASDYDNYPTFPAKTDGTNRNCVSFTSGLQRVTGTTASGPVTYASGVFTGLAAGAVNSSSFARFHPDMVGMYWQWGSDTSDSKVYRIVSYTSASVIGTVDPDTGSAVDFSGASYNLKTGQVFSGVELVKEDDFDNSTSPDEELYPIELFGSSLALDPKSGLARHSGEFASFGYTVASTDDYQNTLVFESGGASATDDSEIGTDLLDGPLYTGSTDPGELRFDSTATFTVIDGQPYAGATATSTQPNEDLEIAQDTEANSSAEPLFWGSLEPTDAISGRRRVAVTFFDQDQAVESNPSPILEIEPPAEDRANPSGQVRMVLSNLPVSPQPGDVRRFVYMSLADSRSLFRVAEINDNVSGSVGLNFTERQILKGIPLRFDRPAPPDCGVLAASQGAMFYGAIKGQPDLIRYSTPFFPTSVPYSQILPVVAGKNEPVTAMADLKGRLVVFKRGAMVRVLLRQGLAVQEVISRKYGCLGPSLVQSFDDYLLFVSGRGPTVYLGAGLPRWVGGKVKDILDVERTNGDVNFDPDLIANADSAVSDLRNQFVIAFQDPTDDEARRRITVELAGELSEVLGIGEQSAAFRFSSYEDPNLTAIESVDRKNGGPDRMLGGTEDGFFVWLDVGTTQHHLMGETAALYGPTQITTGVSSTTSKLVLSGALSGIGPTSLEGQRGATLRWLVSSTEHTAKVLFSDGSNVWLDRVISTAPASGVTISVAAIPYLWESKWLDMGTPELRKKHRYINFTLTPQASGSAILEVLTNYGSTAQQVRRTGTLSSTTTIDLTNALFEQGLGEVRSEYIKFRVRTLTPNVGQRVELIDMELRSEDTDTH